MTAMFPIKGYWYLPGRQDQKIAGVLSVENDRFRLELFGSFGGNSYANYLTSLDWQSASTIPLILGRGSNGKDYSLISAIQGASSLNFNADFPLTSYLTDIVLQGCLLDDPDEKIFTKIRIEFSHLQEWLGFSGISRNGIDRTGFSLSYRYPESITFPINDKRKIMFGYHYSYNGPNRFQRDIIQTCFLDIESEIPLSYRNLGSSMYLFQDFLSMATLSEPHIKSTKLYWQLSSNGGSSNENIELDLYIDPPSTKKVMEKHFSKFLFQYDDVKSFLPVLIHNWFSLADDFWPIRKYLIESIKPIKSFEVNHFLNIVQAIEGFHRRFRVEKKMDLRVRLKSMLQEFSNVNQITNTFQGTDEILSQIVDSRHYYSHFFKKENDKTLEGKNLFYLTRKIRMLLIACVLKETGFNDIAISKALSHLGDVKLNLATKTTPNHKSIKPMAALLNTFSGNPKTEWLTETGDDRNMKLLEDFFYIDPKGKQWNAPAGSVVNGASIPVPLWSIIGSPYTGEYRRASIVHDIACDNTFVPRREADEMFYHACIAGGCKPKQAEVLYAGVRIGAWFPKVRLWHTKAMIAPPITEASELDLTGQSVVTTFKEIRADLLANPSPLTFEDLETIVDKHLSAKEKQ